MPLTTISSQFGSGGTGVTDGTLRKAVVELQGLTTKVIPAKGQDMAMPLAGIKANNKVQSAIVFNSGVPIDVTSDIVVVGDGLIKLDTIDTYKGTKASGTLTSDNLADVSDGDTVTIGTKVYTFKTTLTVPAVEGQVKIAGTADGSLLNLIRAINHSGTPGTDYNCAAANTKVSAATSVTSHAFAVTALTDGTDSHAVATTEVAATLSWGAAALAGGSDGKPMVVTYFIL
jgi:hypothetical protein